ncbi:cupin domain-containing protein [Paraburkholderia sp. MMS20-SJTN17]|uniref:Cupin domain-containing protein n=1 Tax=Paraburkholderia translucens TaxID=2886945 RepID=A0ABS8KFJ9_9BURK|nr:cupin domain-containing protein [Paraburkholderia sp. MMS20-SJTN17]MCC8403465.1 cupin domain-containing protein [Paraburkholderia sp. MMS20-SJTN17]
MPDSRSIADELIRRFELKPHPEGGFFAETYRSDARVLRAGQPGKTDGTRAASTAIYYLLRDGAHSAWHRIRSDEVWHFYAGEPLLVHVLDESNAGGTLVTHQLGNPLTHPHTVCQGVVPAGLWFAAECADPASFALVGCTVAPGFEFSEFELADVGALKARHPRHAELIGRLGPAA